jgi:hypothetical protein
MKKGLISLERLEFEVLRDELNQEKKKNNTLTIDDFFKVNIIKRTELMCNQT